MGAGSPSTPSGISPAGPHGFPAASMTAQARWPLLRSIPSTRIVGSTRTRSRAIDDETAVWTLQRAHRPAYNSMATAHLMPAQIRRYAAVQKRRAEEAYTDGTAHIAKEADGDHPPECLI